MAFNSDDFLPLSGMANSNAPRMFTYTAPADTITGANYFDGSFVAGVAQTIVGRRIRADQLGCQLAPVAQGDDDLVGVGDDMVVGKDVTFQGIDDDARADALDLLFALQGRQIEKTAKEGIGHQRVLLDADPAARGDVDDRRCDLLDHWRKRGQWLSIDSDRQAA